MLRLTSMPEGATLRELMGRLERAGIRAVATPETSAAQLYIGGQRSVGVWIDRPEDAEAARALAAELTEERTAARCPACRYDLRGHAGDETCPECGHALRAAVPDVACPHCGEDVPGDFDVCWQCGGEMPAAGSCGGTTE